MHAIGHLNPAIRPPLKAVELELHDVNVIGHLAYEVYAPVGPLLGHIACAQFSKCLYFCRYSPNCQPVLLLLCIIAFPNRHCLPLHEQKHSEITLAA